MPKSASNLIEKVFDYNNLYSAYLKARKSKRYRPEVLRFSANLEENLITLQNEIIWKTYVPRAYRKFYVRDPKKRLISAPDFRDRVVHHAIVKVIEPLFEKKFIFDSYACRKGKGALESKSRILYFARSIKQNEGKFHVLKADVSKYFYSINIDALKIIISRTIKDPDMLQLIAKIIDFDTEEGVGLPIGALTSQLFANVYLDSLDHFIKDDQGVKKYVRYMDDFIILHSDKEYLKNLLYEIRNFLSENLHLSLNNKTQIFPSSRGIDFCGYRIWTTHVLPRKRVVKNIRQKIRYFQKHGHSDYDIKSSVLSFLGYAKHCNGYNISQSIFSKLNTRKKI